MGTKVVLKISDCHKRDCRHYLGVTQPDGTELTEVHFCKAFLDGVPYEISHGGNKHLEPWPSKENPLDNGIQYEKK